MRPAGCEAEMIRALAEMPFIDRTDLAAVSGWSKGAVYGAVASLDKDGLCDAVTTPPASFPPPNGSTSPPPGWSGWPKTRAFPLRNCSSPIPYRPAGGAS